MPEGKWAAEARAGRPSARIQANNGKGEESMGFAEKLEAYGVDVAATMERVANSEQLYLKCLDIFIEDTNLDKLKSAIEQGDWRSAFEAAHALKGVSANLGLQPFLDRICAMVEPLRRRDAATDYPSLYEAVVQEMERVKALRAELGE